MKRGNQSKLMPTLRGKNRYGTSSGQTTTGETEWTEQCLPTVEIFFLGFFSFFFLGSKKIKNKYIYVCMYGTRWIERPQGRARSGNGSPSQLLRRPPCSVVLAQPVPRVAERARAFPVELPLELRNPFGLGLARCDLLGILPLERCDPLGLGGTCSWHAGGRSGGRGC